MNVDGFDFPEFLEAHKNVFESGDPFQYKGMSINPKELQKFTKNQAKFKIRRI